MLEICAGGIWTGETISPHVTPEANWKQATSALVSWSLSTLAGYNVDGLAKGRVSLMLETMHRRTGPADP